MKPEASGFLPNARFPDVFVHPTAEIEEDVAIGAGTLIWHYAQIRSGARIGTNCSFGRNVYIDVNVLIGNGVRVQNGVSIYDGVQLADDVFVGPHVAFTNDLYPRAFNKEWTKVPTIIERGVSFGANATVVCGVTIGEYAMISAGSVVAADVPPYALVRGVRGEIVGSVDKSGKPK